MSKLEQLARQRAQRNNTSLEGDHPSSAATTKSAALLGRLKGSLRQRNLEHEEQQASENSTVNQGPVQLERPSLADRLRQIQQQRKEGNAGGAATSTTAPTDTIVTNRSDGAKNNILSQIPNPSSSSMKLQTLKLRRQSQLGDTPVKTVAEITHNKVIVTANEAPIGPETSLNKVDRVRRDFLQFKRLQKSAEVRIRATRRLQWNHALTPNFSHCNRHCHSNRLALTMKQVCAKGVLGSFSPCIFQEIVRRG